MPARLRNYFKENPSIYNIVITSKLFQVIEGKLTIRNNSKIYSEKSLITGYLSIVSLADSIITNVAVYKEYIQTSLSTLSMTNMRVSNLTTLDTSNFIY